MPLFPPQFLVVFQPSAPLHTGRPQSVGRSSMDELQRAFAAQLMAATSDQLSRQVDPELMRRFTAVAQGSGDQQAVNIWTQVQGTLAMDVSSEAAVIESSLAYLESQWVFSSFYFFLLSLCSRVID